MKTSHSYQSLSLLTLPHYFCKTNRPRQMSNPWKNLLQPPNIQALVPSGVSGEETSKGHRNVGEITGMRLLNKGEGDRLDNRWRQGQTRDIYLRMANSGNITNSKGAHHPAISYSSTISESRSLKKTLCPMKGETTQTNYLRQTA